jgi:hypothetical protein
MRRTLIAPPRACSGTSAVLELVVEGKPGDAERGLAGLGVDDHETAAGKGIGDRPSST